MGGSSGVFTGTQRSPQVIAAQLKKAAEEEARGFETSLARIFNSLLVKLNDRDAEEVRVRLKEIKEILGGYIESSMDTLFGGSVAKHTYVDGISDVDSLLIFQPSEEIPPHKLLRRIERTLKKQLDSAASVSCGDMAVTVAYNNGPEVQLIPAIKAAGSIKIPEPASDSWSKIDPQKFNAALSKRNIECAGKLIPTLKLVKAINVNLPKQLRLTGYHIEALGVAAFREYTGHKTTTAMLPYFFKASSQLVLAPITDKTGQSVHVDEYLGKANSDLRSALSHTLTRLHIRMLNASAAHSEARWRDLFGES